MSKLQQWNETDYTDNICCQDPNFWEEIELVGYS